MIKRVITRYPIWSFLIINYFISWIFLYPSYQLILKHERITPLALIGMIGAYGPTIAAIAVQFIIDRSQVRHLLRKVIKIRISPGFLAGLIFIPLIVYTISYGLAIQFHHAEIIFNPGKAVSGMMIWVLLALPFGPMGEELGWRGFMLPRLLNKYGALRSTMLIGLAWGIWHLASFTFPGAAIPDFLPVNIYTIGLYILNTIGLSFLFTYMHLKSGGSVFYAILLHAFFNAAANVSVDLFGESQSMNVQVMAYCLNFIIAGILGFCLIYFKQHPTANEDQPSS